VHQLFDAENAGIAHEAGMNRRVQTSGLGRVEGRRAEAPACRLDVELEHTRVGKGQHEVLAVDAAGAVPRCLLARASERGARVVVRSR
jgi:hypothetical protein